MPEVENAADPQAAAEFDPFDAEEASLPASGEEISGELAPTDVAAMQDAFDEPPAADEPSSESTELDAARSAIDEEIMRREVESGAADETVQPEQPADEATQMEDEVVQPEDGAEQLDADLLENFGESPSD
ncbi:MAG: hypothetical protein DCC67_18520, partial [Planctomycetota bacterium]